MSHLHPQAAMYTELSSAGADIPASNTTASPISKVPRSKSAQLKPSWLSGILSKPTGTFSLPSRRRKTSVVEAAPKPKKSKGSLGLTTLYEPPDGVVIAEMIFIHGLGGGSIKTWCDSSGPAPPSCWPRDWLPADAEFEHVRIHTFGYEADWRERTPSILSVHDFAQSLLGEMMNHQLIKRSDAGIVLVGHSMGGCVAKKAYILARQDPACADLASRFHSMFFLATPHRGSELGKVLRNLLLVTGVSKPYVKDLVANSGPVLEVNEAFHQYASDLHLWSFFESLPMSDYSNILVVDKHSATLGFDNESVSLMDADHRTICKFKYQSDHNYRKLRNALLSAVEMIKSNSPRMVAKARLGPYLGVDDSFEDDLVMHREARHPESCAWIVQDPGFRKWTLFDPESPPIYWLVAGMGTGKSTMCSRIVDYICQQSEPMRCSYFFIKRARGEMRDLSPLLLNIAFQMGLQDAQVRRAIVRLQEGGVSWEGQTDKLIWRKLFQEAIFNVKSPLTHFWIIDGLDEYSGTSDIYQFLEQLPQHVRVFVASQHTPEIQDGMLSLGQRLSVWMVEPEQTLSDMRFVVKARLEQLSHLETGDDLVSRIVEKSDGSFIWIRLVLKELETAFTDEDVEAILEEVPSDLHEMYARILHSIEKDKRRAKLAKSILTWITLAQRPMTIEELRGAVHMDIRASPQKMVHAAVVACGQFLLIDQSRRLHLVHDTARQFLCRGDLDSQFAITPAEDHGHLAELCLAYLAKYLAVDRSAQHAESSSFLWYAAEWFSQHLVDSKAGEPLTPGTITQFLDQWVLYWIESLAQRRKLGVAVQSAINLERYAERGKEEAIWSSHDIIRLKDWTSDLSRVVLNFREPLLKSPAAIHHLVPPLCPTQSLTYRHASSSGDTELAMLGHRNQRWDECLMCIEHAAFVEVVACGRHHAAIGISTGYITVYDMTLLQNTIEVKFPRLRLIGFGCDDKYLAATGFGQAAIWETKTGALRHAFDCDSVLSFSFTLNHFITVSSSGATERRNLETKELDKLQWSTFDTASIQAPLPSSAACEASFDETCPQRFAVAFYSSGDIYLMDIDEHSVRGILKGPGTHFVKEFTFNPHPEKQLLVASYTGGGLAIFDTNTMCQLYHKSDMFANHVSWTTDGKHLVIGTGETAYTLELYKVRFSDAISLDLIRQVDHPGIPVTPLVVASQGKRIIGAHSRQSRIWEFPMLGLQEGQEPEDATADDESHKPEQLPRGSRETTGSRKSSIAAMALSDDGRVVICGTESGEVVAFSALDGSRMARLHQEHKCAITSLVIAQDTEGDLIITGDQEGFVVLAKAVHEHDEWGSANIEFAQRCGNLVEQMLLSPSKDRLLIIGLSASELWSLPSMTKLESLRVPRSSANLRRAAQFPLMDDRFIVLEDSRTHVFYWRDFGRASDGKLSLHRDGRLPEPEHVTNTSYLSNDRVFVEKLADPLTGVRTNCWDMNSFLAGNDQAVEILPRRGLQALSFVLGDIISAIGSTLVFLHKERWISTVDLDTFHLTMEVRRHFFIPPEWVSILGSVICALTPEKSLVFASRQDVVIVRGWMGRWETDLLGHFDMDAELKEYAETDIWVTGRPLR